MSTNYYRLKSPITHLKLESGKKNSKLYVWTSHKQAGKLVLDNDEIGRVLGCFTEKTNRPSLRTYWSGDTPDLIVVENETLPDNTLLVSSNGELCTVGEVKSRGGVNKYA